MKIKRISLLLLLILFSTAMASAPGTTAQPNPEVTPEATAEVQKPPVYSPLARMAIIQASIRPLTVRALIVDRSNSGKATIYDSYLDSLEPMPDCDPLQVSISESGQYVAALCEGNSLVIGELTFTDEQLSAQGITLNSDDVAQLIPGQLVEAEIYDGGSGVSLRLFNGELTTVSVTDNIQNLGDPRSINLRAEAERFVDTGLWWHVALHTNESAEVMAMYAGILEDGQKGLVFDLRVAPTRVLAAHLLDTLIPDHEAVLVVPESGELLIKQNLAGGRQKIKYTACPTPLDPRHVAVTALGENREYTVISSLHARGLCAIVLDNATMEIIKTHQFPGAAGAITFATAHFGEVTLISWIHPDGRMKTRVIYK